LIVNPFVCFLNRFLTKWNNKLIGSLRQENQTCSFFPWLPFSVDSGITPEIYANLCFLIWRLPMIIIIDFGSQFNQLIARRVRENRVYCQIEPPTITAEQLRSLSPEGIVLSGGPASIYEKDSPSS
jgi:hypothetical protein